MEVNYILAIHIFMEAKFILNSTMEEQFTFPKENLILIILVFLQITHQIHLSHKVEQLTHTKSP